VSGVMIGIDPHKGSHTAFVLDASETKLGQVRVPAAVGQVNALLQWAQRWPERRWAVEGATGLGHLLAQQLDGSATPRPRRPIRDPPPGAIATLWR
jgi:transposase